MKDCRSRLVFLQWLSCKINMHYNLQKAYQNRENLLSIRLIFPLSWIHSSIFLTYLVLVLVVKNFLFFKDALTYIIFIESATLLVNWYVFCTFAVFLWLRLKMENSTKSLAKKVAQDMEADVYFKQLRNQLG
uniref:Gustatory receptor n=1 Tax=Ditylenchus dipsaci TaxID=166011 RepID=A0A915DS86_9BILA